MPLMLTTFLILMPLVQAPSAVQRVECREWRECRALANDAYTRGDYERFHDLAWKTVQIGPPRNPDLMYLVARAQSLSGRPHDAFVMLSRLAEMGVATDAAANDDFRAVRNLRDWPTLEALIAAVPSTAASLPRATEAPKPAPATPEAAASRVTVAPSPPATKPAFAAEDALRLPATVNPTGLSYDRVSGRFVVADRRARKLFIIDERSLHLVDLVGADSAGFYEITALEIDGRRGDLWVVSANGSAAGNEATTVLHKLQLVSGRPLAALPLPRSFGAARFDDVSVSDGGMVFVLDGLGGRIFHLASDGRTFALAGTLQLEHLTSIAPVNDRVAYVSHAQGIARLDGTAAPTEVTGGKEGQLAGFERIRWDRDALIGIQRLPDGNRQVVHLRLDRSGQRVVGVDVIDPQVSMPDPSAATLSDHIFYFMTREARGSNRELEIVVRRAQLR
jgi:hypothetical protein